MIEWAEALFSGFGLYGLFVMALMEASFFPVPPDPLLILLVSKNQWSPWHCAFVCTAGSVIGAAFGWTIGRVGGRPLVYKFFKRDKLVKVESLYERYGMWAVFVSAFTPLPFKVFTISSGMFRLNFLALIFVSLIGRGGRFFFVSYLAVTLKPEEAFKQLDVLAKAVGAATLIVVIGYVAWYWWRKSKIKHQ